VLTCVGLLVVPAASAVERVVNGPYAGTDFNTSVDSNLDGQPAGMMLATGAGGAQLGVSSEWVYESGQGCLAGYDLRFALLQSAGVTTYSDRSQLFYFADNGWLCLSTTTGAFYGELSGVYTGGTGRFAGATGTYTTKFEGQNLDPAGTIRSIQGSSNGRITTP
jgi:hypothetical protein